MKKVLVVGAGMAGSEAAYFLASRGLEVVLVESKRVQKTPAQKSPDFAELVCTNSLKSMREDSAHGLLKLEMHSLGSVILECAEKAKVPAGDALAVDREQFSRLVTQKLNSHPRIQVVDAVIDDPLAALEEFQCTHAILATGPLTHPGLERWIQEELSSDDFYFYDAIAPVVDADTLDFSQMYFKDRYKEEGESADYLNVPLNKEQYENFIADLKTAEKVRPKNFEEEKFFESCLPIDLMAERGVETARFSCMKPVGLEDQSGRCPHAVIQLRKENLLGQAFNLVGFQTRLTYPEQKRVFKKLPGFQEASFIHLGSVHRNSFLNARKLLSWDMSSHRFPQLAFAGQITGVEGYTESASSGLYVAYQLYRKICGEDVVRWPVQTAIGALINYIMTMPRPTPSNINFGLIPSIPLTKEQRKSRDRKKVKKQLVAQRAQTVFTSFMAENPLS